MTGSRYTGAWTFDVSVTSLYQAAYAYQSIRLFRLVRIRQQAMFKSTGTASLASLPVEICSMIEADIMNYELQEALKRAPQNDCECPDVYSDFMDDEETTTAFFDFCDSLELPEAHLMTAGVLDYAMDAFQASDVHRTLWDSFFYEHLSECEGMWIEDDYWEGMMEYLRDRLGAVTGYMQEIPERQTLDKFFSDKQLEVFAIERGVYSTDLTLAFSKTVTPPMSNFDMIPSLPSYDTMRFRHELRKIGLSPTYRWRYDGKQPVIEWKIRLADDESDGEESSDNSDESEKEVHETSSDNVDDVEGCEEQQDEGGANKAGRGET